MISLMQSDAGVVVYGQTHFTGRAPTIPDLTIQK
jgi:hypothetical protein